MDMQCTDICASLYQPWQTLTTTFGVTNKDTGWLMRPFLVDQSLYVSLRTVLVLAYLGSTIRNTSCCIYTTNRQNKTIASSLQVYTHNYVLWLVLYAIKWTWDKKNVSIGETWIVQQHWISLLITSVTISKDTQRKEFI